MIPETVEIVPVCPLDVEHDVQTNEDCWACGLIGSLYRIATITTDSGDPIVEASYILDEFVEWRPK